MIPSNHLLNKLSKTLKLSSSQKKETCRNSETVGCELQSEILSHLSMMTFIANQLGYKLSWKLSRKKR